MALKHCYEWKDKYGGRITKQLRKLGEAAIGRVNALQWTIIITKK